MIRRATDLDIKNIAYLEKGAIECAWSYESLLEVFNNESYVFFVDVYSNMLAGYIFFRKVLDEAEICNIAVDTAFRKQGRAKRLIEKALEHCLHSDIKSVFLEVNQSNTPAICLYKGYGFDIIAQRKNYYKNSQTALVMKKQL